MKLDAKTVAALKLGGKKDAIFFDDSLKGFGYRLRAGAGGKTLRTWIVQYRHAGCGRRYKIGPAEAFTPDEARAEAKKVLAKVWQGLDPQTARIDRQAKDKLSFRSVVEDFLAAKEREVRPRTLFQLRRYLTGPYLKAFHTMALDRVSKRDVASRVLTIAHENGPAVAREVRGALSGFYSWAMQMGLAEANPIIGTKRPKTNEPRERVLDDGELVAIWKACADNDYGKIVKLLILTGCRRAEIGDMRWSEIDLERGTFTIPAMRSKNHRQHVLPLMPTMREIITGVPRMASRDQLFGLRAAAGFTAWSWKESKPALDERSKVRNWTVHDIRRSVATKMADIGVQPHIIEAALNHFSGHRGGIAGVYNRSTYEREVRNALALWHDHLRALVEGGERKVLAYPAAAT